jgi:hypothetical protein
LSIAFLLLPSYKPGVVSGAVAGSDESDNRAELHGLSVTGSNPTLVGVQRVTDLPSRPIHHELEFEVVEGAFLYDF